MANEVDPDLGALKIDRAGARRRKRRSPWFARALWLVVLAALFWLFQRPVRDFVDRVRLPEVSVIRATLRSPAAAGATSGAAANGYVVARTRAALSADAPGRLVELNVAEGSFVKQGDVVARLYHDELSALLERATADLALSEAALERVTAEEASARAELDQFTAEVESAQAARAGAEADLRLARADLARVEELARAGHETAARLDAAASAVETAQARQDGAAAGARSAAAAVRRAESRVAVAEASIAEAEAQVDVADASLDQAAAALEKTFVRAPFDGVVVQKEAEVGEVVSPNSQGGSRARGSVVTMVDLASLEVQADVPETSLSAVRVGEPALIYLDAWPTEPYRGRIDRIWPAADRQKATVEVRVVFDRLDQRLRPDMGVRVVFLESGAEGAELDLEAARPVVMVAREAIVRVGGRDGVFVVERDVARFHALSLGAERLGRVVVEKGLEGGEAVVADPPPTLADGDRVRVKEEA